MILSDKELTRLRQYLEGEGGMDAELLRRCGHLLHLEAYDEAVRSAFVLLEERLRAAINEQGMTGSQLANKAFSPTSHLTMHLGSTPAEREGLREIFSGAFKLFRNPTAHGAVGYNSVEGNAIVGFVNLLLGMVKRVEELPPPDLFPKNVENLLASVEQKHGPGVASRLRVFLGKCIRAGITPSESAKTWIPFKKYALAQFEQWEAPKSHKVAIFYLTGYSGRYTIFFSTAYYLPNVVGFDLDQLTDSLAEIGFLPEGKRQEPTVDVKLKNDQAFFEKLFGIVSSTAEALEASLNI